MTSKINYIELTRRTDTITIKGIVVKTLPNREYKVELENGLFTIAYIPNRFKVPKSSGRGFGKPNINLGDKVLVEVIIGDSRMSRGMLVGFQK